MEGYADLADSPEDDRIRMIGTYLTKHPGRIIRGRHE